MIDRKYKLTPEMEVELDLIRGEKKLRPRDYRQINTVLEAWSRGRFGKTPGENAFNAANRIRTSLNLPLYAGGQ